MKRIVSMLYVIVFTVIVLVAGSIIIEFIIVGNYLNQGLEREIILKNEIITESISTKLDGQSRVIAFANSLVIYSENEDKLVLSFKDLLKKNPEFSDLYYLKSDNTFIDASGWTPDSNFNPLQRPWFKGAIQSGKLIFTDAYLNASEPNLIISIAAPVYDEKGNYLGVVGGDIPLTNIIKLSTIKQDTKNEESFITDSIGNILAHSEYGYNTSSLINIKEISSEMSDYLINGSTGISTIMHNGKRGYFTYERISGTGWKVVSYIGFSQTLILGKITVIVVLSVAVSAAIIIFLIIILQKRFIVKPLLNLDADIKSISSDIDKEFRLSEDINDPFYEIRTTINYLISQIIENFEKLQTSNDKLQEKSEELSSTILQLGSVENELRKQYESLYISRASLRASEECNKAIISSLPDIVMRIDIGGKIIACMSGEYNNFGKTCETIIDKQLAEIMPIKTANIAMNSLNEAFKTDKVVEFEYETEMNGVKEIFEVRLSKSRKDEAIAILRNVTDQKDNLKRIEYLSYRDRITGLFNRRYFEEKIAELDNPKNYPISIAMMDINGLKLVNDAFGHATGDKLIKIAAQLIEETCEPEHIAIRIGGDEFILIMLNTKKEDALSFSEKIKSLTADHDIKGVPVSFSIGLKTKESNDQNIYNVISAAEEILYSNKLKETQEMRIKTIDKIMDVIYERNAWERDHSINVAKLSKMIGNEMGLGLEKLNNLNKAGLLHDIGKIALNEDILACKTQDDLKDPEGFKKHPEIGYQIVRSVDNIACISTFILSHHERWDGKGYPRNLKGEEIPLEARIIAVAEYYDAFTTIRVDDEIRTKDEAISSIQKMSGSKFDPQVVDALINIKEFI